MNFAKDENAEMEHNGVIADTVHGSIELSGFEKKIMSHVVFNRLHDVYQNSTVYLTFPCNRAKRFEHSIGTMKLCGDMFSYAVENTEPEILKEFFELYKNKMGKILGKIKGRSFKNYEQKFGGRINKIDASRLPDPIGLGLKKINLANDLNEYYSCYCILLEAIRIAGLLHDVGHPPYSHITEYALGNIAKQVEENIKKTHRQKEFFEIMNQSLEDDEKPLHEQMGNTIVGIVMEDSIENISEQCANTNGELFNQQIFYVLVKEVVEHILNDVKPFHSLHRIVDGTLDGDRLDYVTRDAFNSGLKKGIIEYDRLCNKMIIAKIDEEFWICADIKSLNTIEDYLNRRWDMYKNIIFHHRVIKTDYLLQNIVEKIAQEYLEAEDFDGEKTEEDLLPDDISGLWKAFKSGTNIDSAYAICQWDDSWLITVLKKYYFKDYIKRNDVISKQLSELLTYKKHYFSVIKRLEDFLIIDKAIAKSIQKEKAEIEALIKKLRQCSRDNKKEERETVPIDPFLTSVEGVLALTCNDRESNMVQGLVFSKLKQLWIAGGFTQKEIQHILEKLIDSAKIEFETGVIEDIFVVMKKYNIGLNKPLKLYDRKQEREHSIFEVSAIAKILELSYDTFPQFHIYILKKDQFESQYVDVTKFLDKLGEEIGNYFCENWKVTLENNIKQYDIEEN